MLMVRYRISKVAERRGRAGRVRMLDELSALMVQLEEDINSTGWTGRCRSSFGIFLALIPI